MKINLYFFIMFIIACIAFIGDIIIYLFKLNYLFGLILATIIIGGISVVFLKKKKLYMNL